MSVHQEIPHGTILYLLWIEHIAGLCDLLMLGNFTRKDERKNDFIRKHYSPLFKVEPTPNFESNLVNFFPNYPLLELLSEDSL
jgi:hypothetical protein